MTKPSKPIPVVRKTPPAFGGLKICYVMGPDPKNYETVMVSPRVHRMLQRLFEKGINPNTVAKN